MRGKERKDPWVRAASCTENRVDGSAQHFHNWDSTVKDILFSLDWFEISQSVLAFRVNIWLGVNLVGNFLNFKVFLHFRGPAVSLLTGASH